MSCTNDYACTFVDNTLGIGSSSCSAESSCEYSITTLIEDEACTEVSSCASAWLGTVSTGACSSFGACEEAWGYNEDHILQEGACSGGDYVCYGLFNFESIGVEACVGLYAW